MIMFHDKRNGSAVCIALILSVLMLVMALSYSKLTTGVKQSSAHVDEQVRLKYLADGVAQVALLKFKLYPTDFYVAWEAADTNPGPLNIYNNSEEFQNASFLADQKTAFAVDNKDLDTNPITIDFKGYTLRTYDRSNNTVRNKWKSDILTITTEARYKPDSTTGDISATSVLTVQTSHFVPQG